MIAHICNLKSPEKQPSTLSGSFAEPVPALHWPMALTKRVPLLSRRDMPSLVSNILSEYWTPAAWSFSPSSAVVYKGNRGRVGRRERGVKREVREGVWGKRGV